MTYVEYYETVCEALNYAIEQVESSGGEVEVLEGMEPSEQAGRLQEALKNFKLSV